MRTMASLTAVGMMLAGCMFGSLWMCSSDADAGGRADHPWPCFMGNQRHTGLSPYDTSYVNGFRMWSRETIGYIDSSPTIDSNGTIYIGTGCGAMLAYNPDGSKKLDVIIELITIHWFSSAAIGNDGTIYIAGTNDVWSVTGTIFALNPTFSIKWSYKINGAFYSSPVIGGDGKIYIGSDDKKLYAMRPDGTVNWTFTTGGSVRSSPAIGSDGTIYFGSDDGKLYAVKPDGDKKWEYATGDRVRSSPAVGSDGTIFFGSDDKKLYALDPAGKPKWNYTTGKSVSSSPAIGKDGTIYFGSDDNNLYALQPTGALKWSYATSDCVRSSPAIGDDGAIYFGSNDDNLYALYPNGTLKWSYKTSGDLTSSPAIGNDGNIYVASSAYLQKYGVAYLPTAPRELKAAASSKKVILNWTEPENDGDLSINQYKIYRGTSSGEESLIKTLGDVREYTDTGLTNGLTYFYQVSATNDKGEGPKSNEVSATPDYDGSEPVPSPPRNLTATADDKRIALEWQVPTFNGSSAILNYSIYRGANSMFKSHIAKVGNILSYTDKTVSNGEKYYYHVTAINSEGEGDRSNEVGATPVSALAPSAPRNLRATPGNNTVFLEWEPPLYNFSSGSESFYVYRNTGIQDEIITPVIASKVGDSFCYTDKTVSNGETYYYQVAAYGIYGPGRRSNEVRVTPGVSDPGKGPPAPRNLRATAGNGAVLLQWQPPLTGGDPGPLTYLVYRGTTSGGETLLGTAGSSLNYTDRTVTNERTYYYQVSAANASGEGYRTGEVNVTPGVAALPTSPLNLKATVGDKQVRLAWQKPASTGGSAIIDYIVYRNGTLLAHAGANTTYKDTKVQNGVNYSYEVSAVNFAGEGQRSNKVTATPKVQPKQNPKGFIPGFALVELTGAVSVLFFVYGRRRLAGREFGYISDLRNKRGLLKPPK